MSAEIPPDAANGERASVFAVEKSLEFTVFAEIWMDPQGIIGLSELPVTLVADWSA